MYTHIGVGGTLVEPPIGGAGVTPVTPEHRKNTMNDVGGELYETVKEFNKIYFILEITFIDIKNTKG